MRRIALILALIAPAAAFAVGSDDSTPATPTQTTKDCSDGMVWDETTKACVAPKDSRLDDDTRYRAAREFAHGGQFNHALDALEAMDEGRTDRVLTYLGFVHRKMGDRDLGMAFYAAALEQNPDNLLARSYRGQAYMVQGNTVAARAELSEIRKRGGRGSWPETALRLALETGSGPTY